MIGCYCGRGHVEQQDREQPYWSDNGDVQAEN
jgi:hypothetical protein